MTCPLKCFVVSVDGHEPVNIDAPTAGKARSRAWDLYRSGYPCLFKHFLKISSVRLCKDVPVGYGHKIMVSGELAYYLGRIANSVKCVRPGEEHAVYSHELDVTGLDDIAALAA